MKFNGTYGYEMAIDSIAFIFGVENAVVFAEFRWGEGETQCSIDVLISIFP